MEKALGLDPNLAEAHAALGRMRGLYDWDWSGATAAYKRALELGPGNATVVLGLAGQAATLGHLEEALRLDRRAIEMDPLNVGAHHGRGNHAWRAGRLDEAEAAFRKVLDLDPGRDGGLTSIKGHPLLRNLEADPRYPAFLTKMRLPL